MLISVTRKVAKNLQSALRKPHQLRQVTLGNIPLARFKQRVNQNLFPQKPLKLDISINKNWITTVFMRLICNK